MLDLGMSLDFMLVVVSGTLLVVISEDVPVIPMDIMAFLHHKNGMSVGERSSKSMPKESIMDKQFKVTIILLSIMLERGDGFHWEDPIQAFQPAQEMLNHLLQIAMINAVRRFSNCGFDNGEFLVEQKLLTL